MEIMVFFGVLLFIMVRFLASLQKVLLRTSTYHNNSRQEWVGKSMQGLTLKALQLITSKVMKHPCLYGLVCVFGAALLLWTISQYTAFAMESFPRPPTRIFPRQSYVTDIYNGSLETLDKVLKRTDLRFVAFYAPWCAQSRRMVPKVEEAAKQLKNKIGFIAINCWIGTCKNNFPVREFPKFYAYHTKYPPVEFLEPPDSWRIVRFLNSISRPFHYVGNERDLKELITSQEVVVVGYFNMQKKFNKQLSIFLKLCIASLNRVSKILYGIVTNSKMAALAGLRSYGQIILHQILGDKKYFPIHESNYTAEAIIQWILKTKVEIVVQLTPNMTHLDDYVTHLKKGPAVLLFLSFRPHLKKYATSLLHQYRELATSYSDCRAQSIENKSSIKDLKTRHLNSDKDSFSTKPACKLSCNSCMTIPLYHHGSICMLCQKCTGRKCHSKNLLNKCIREEIFIERARTLKNICKSMRRMSYYYQDFISICCETIDTKHGALQTDILRKTAEKLEQKYRNQKLFFDAEIGKLEKSGNAIFESALKIALKAIENLSKISASNEVSSTNFDKLLQGSLPEVNDKQSLQENVDVSKQLKRRNILERINKVSTGSNHALDLEIPTLRVDDLQKPLPRQKYGNFSSKDLDGLRCKTNRSVNYFYLDIDKHENMIKKFGIKQNEIQNLTTLVLLDLKNEAAYVLEESVPVSKTSIIEFVTNYTNKRLERRLRSSESKNVCSEMSNSTCIYEATTNTFKHIVLDESKDVLLMYYAPWCGFCKQGYKVLLQLAIAYSGLNSLRFARINADENDLPYHYTVDGYPSFILFPRRRKSYSYTYPDDLAIQFKNMEQFLLRHSSRMTRTNMKLRNSGVR